MPPTVFLLGLLLTPAASGQAPTNAANSPEQLVSAAIAQTQSRVTDDGSYRRIAYPGGDVPETIGVCTDVVIRAYRRIGIDLQADRRYKTFC